MTSVKQCRYALWHHSSQVLSGQVLEWRETPRSKALIGIVPAVVLPGTTTVVCAEAERITLQLCEQQVAVLRRWLSALPDDVLDATALDTFTIDHSATYGCVDTQMNATSVLPKSGDRVMARVTANVSRVGPMRKAHIIVVDVLRTDVATEPDENKR